MSPHCNTFLLINQQRVLFNSNILLQPFFVLHKIREGVIGLCQLIFQQPDAFLQLFNLHGKVAVRLVVAQLHVGTAEPFFQPGLRHFQRRMDAANRDL